MKKVLYMHTGSGNHGCEAIIRGTSCLLDGPKDLILWSFNPAEDLKYKTAELVERVYASEELGRFSIDRTQALVRRRLLKDGEANIDVFIKRIFKNSIAISVGGDNYCYPWSANQLSLYNKKIRKYCRYSVLWGCSVDPEMTTPEMLEDLRKYDLITAREEISFSYLKSINSNTVKVADPAFLLSRVDCPLPEGFQKGNTVGINISPMIFQYASSKDLIIENYQCLIDYILRETDMSICLIPHVVWEISDDRGPINYLYNEFMKSERVCIIEDCNAEELKGFIARCRFFIGARTHATIAAYSSGVPTLAIGYSVKAKGIARDLFGTDEKYVVPVQQMDSRYSLIDRFKWIVENECIQRDQLKTIMSDYLKEAQKGAAAINQLIENSV